MIFANFHLFPYRLNGKEGKYLYAWTFCESTVLAKCTWTFIFPINNKFQIFVDCRVVMTLHLFILYGSKFKKKKKQLNKFTFGVVFGQQFAWLSSAPTIMWRCCWTWVSLLRFSTVRLCLPFVYFDYEREIITKEIIIPPFVYYNTFKMYPKYTPFCTHISLLQTDCKKWAVMTPHS